MLFPNIKKRQEMSETNDSDRAESDAVPQPKEVGTICCPGPSCSSADSPAGADPENAGLDQALEMFACSYNLTAQNVKNIIFHIVKNPQTFATLVRKDPDAMAGLRITRARLRHLERIARRRIPTVRLRPIAAPKTFLDINYGDDEDGDDETGGAGRTDVMKADGGRAEEQEDMDYCPDKDPTATTRRRRKGRGRRKHKNAGQHAEDKEESSSFSSDTDFVGSDAEEEEEANGHGTTLGTEEPPKFVQDGVGGVQPPVVMGEEEEELTRQSVEFLTKVDNPIYPIFIKSLATETEMDLDRQQLYNEDDDSEYVFQDFDDLCEQEDEYEFRQDRATEIPRWEVKALEQDFEDEEDGVGAHPTSLDVPIEPIVGEETTMTTTNGGQNKGVDEMVDCDKESTVKVFWRTNIAKPLTNPRITGQCPQHSSDGNGAASTSTPKAAQAEDGPAKDGIQQPTSSSCSLLNASPTIDRVELDALKVQLEKHVQLLCQAIVGTSQYPKMVDSHNKAMLMLRELDALACERSQQSVFNVPTLEAAIYSAHDIKACREVDLVPSGGEQQHHQSGNDEQRPSNETMWVLSRSGAVRHPELLFSYRFSDGNAQTMRKLTPPPRFLPSEQLLLAIGIYQLNGVPVRQSKACKMRNRFQLIQQHFLPTKRVDQIRNHIRNVHACPSPNIYHQLIMEAEKGHFPVTCRLDLGDKAQQKAPIEWPNELQPFWLKWLSSLLRNSQTQMFMMDNDVDHQNCVQMQQNDICSGLQQHQQQSTSPSSLPNAAVLSTNQCPKQSDNNPTTTSSPSGNNSCFNPSASPHEPEIVKQYPAQQQPQAASSSLSHDDVDNLSTSPHEPEIAAQYSAQQQQKKLKLLPRILSRKRCIASSSTMAQKSSECHESKSLSFICAELHGKVFDEQDDVGGEEDDDDNNNGGDKIVGIQTRWRKRLRTASSIEDGGGGGRHVRGGNGGAVAMCINGGGSADGAEGSATTSTSRTTEHNDNGNKNINNKSSISCNNVLPGTPPQSQQKKSRRHERAERGLAALCDKHAREQTDRALGTAIYEDFKKRMFMHQDKLRAVQRVLARRDVSVAQCFALLCELIGSTHPEMFHLFAALAPEALLPPALRVDPQWQACKRALRMLQTIHTYLGASRTPAQMKHMLKFLREASVDITSEQLFFETLQRQFAVREEPLWRLLRREWMSAKFVETVEDWEYEFVDMDKQQQPKQTDDVVDVDQADEQRFEHVRLPYRYDPSERRRLRVRHGRVTAELNGRLCNVAIGYAPPEELSGPSLAVVAQPSSSTTAPVTASSTIHTNHGAEQQPQKERIPGDVQQQPDRCWTRKMDMELMLSYNKAGGDTKKCVDIFMHNSGHVESDELKNVDKIQRRLEQLLSVVSTLRRPNDKCH
uniref:GON-4-like protein n=1 Tax=Globodera rostochiensis TaxID=31243 RepID=A0A914I8M4_GLORO